MAQINWRTVNVDLYDPESSYNFDIQTVIPGNVPAQSNAQEAAQIAQQVRQLLRAGDGVGALQSALETIPYAGDDQAKQVHLTTCLEVLQGIRQAEVNVILQQLLQQQNGQQLADALCKIIYRGMGGSSSGSRGMTPQQTGQSAGVDGVSRGFSQIQQRNVSEGGSGQAMSVLLSWHEKLVELCGVGVIVRCMSDRRTV